jgi:hypothetical protein
VFFKHLVNIDTSKKCMKLLNPVSSKRGPNNERVEVPMDREAIVSRALRHFVLSIVEFLHEFVIDDVITSWVHVLAFVCMEMTRDKIRFMPREHHLQRTGRVSSDSISSTTSAYSAENGSYASEDEAAVDGLGEVFPDNTFDADSALPSFHSVIIASTKQCAAATHNSDAV